MQTHPRTPEARVPVERREVLRASGPQQRRQIARAEAPAPSCKEVNRDEDEGDQWGPRGPIHTHGAAFPPGRQARAGSTWSPASHRPGTFCRALDSLPKETEDKRQGRSKRVQCTPAVPVTGVPAPCVPLIQALPAWGGTKPTPSRRREGEEFSRTRLSKASWKGFRYLEGCGWARAL